VHVIQPVLLALEEVLLIVFLVQVQDIFNPLLNHVLLLVTQINTNPLILINVSAVTHRVLLVLVHQTQSVYLAKVVKFSILLKFV